MKEIPIPMSEEERTKKGAHLSRLCSALGAFTVIFAVGAVVLLLGVLAAVIAAEFKRDASDLCFLLAGVFGGGAVLFCAAAVGFERLSSVTDERVLDYFERCDGAESFFVGEGTLATFRKDSLCIHGDAREEIFVPYAEITAYSVCARKRPREKGAWSVVFEIPARYLLKKEKGGEPPLLVQTAAKPRLFRALEAHSIPLLGERREETAQKVKYTREKKFYLPNKKKQKRELLFLAFGALLLVAGVLLLILVNPTIGSVLICFAVIVGGKAIFSFFRARALFAVYREGIYWRESDSRESVFLKWEEMTSLTAAEEKGYPVLRVELPYGRYHFPRAAGVCEYLAEHHPEEFRA